MVNVSGLTRATEWWSYKIPPLLGISYALLILTSPAREPLASLGLIAAVMTSIIAVAAYGYVINDCFDIEPDRRAGKKNSMAGRSVAQRAGILLAILAIGWLPAWLAGYSQLACIILAIDFLLPTIYSIPPIRLKERDVLGVLADASAAHLLPTLLIGSVLLGNLESYGGSAFLFLVAATVWYTLVGLRGIINHQLLDREADLASGVVTLATSPTRRRFLNRMRLVLYVLEVVTFAAMIVLISQTVPLVLPVYVLFAVMEMTKRLIGWSHSDRLSPEIGRRAYLPFANNIFYALWLPLFLVLAVAVRWPWLGWIVLVHVAIFGRGSGRGREYREPLDVLKDLFYKIRPIVASWRYGWRVICNRADWPEMSWPSEALGVLRVRSKRALTNPWDLRIIGPRHPVAAGQGYQLRLRLRSEHARSVTVGLCQRHSPYSDVGLTEVVPVNTEWEDFFFDFLATATEPNAGIFLWLGGRDTAVEIAEAQLVCVAAPGPWRLMLTRPAEAWRSRPEDQYLVKVDRIHTDGKPWQVKLTGCHYSIRKGELYRVQVSVRSRGNRPLTFGVSQSYSPFDVVGLCENIVIQDEFQEFQGDFIADQDEEVSIFFWLGGDTSAVEILNADLRPVQVSRLWTLRRKEGCYAWRVATDDPERVVIELGQKDSPDTSDQTSALTSSAWDVTATTPIRSVEKGCWYRVTVAIRSSQERPVTVAVCRPKEPWDILGFCERLVVTPKQRKFTFDFQATCSELTPNLIVAVGENSTLVEIASLDVVAIPESSALLLSVDGASHAVRVLGEDEHSIIIDELQVDGVASHVQVHAARQYVQKGRNYRVNVSVRSPHNRPLTFGVVQSSAPFKVLGVCEEISLVQDQLLELQGDFIAERDEEVNVFLWLGASDASVVISRVELRPNDAAHLWMLKRSLGSKAWQLASDDPESVKVAIGERDSSSLTNGAAAEGPSPWDVSLTTPLKSIEKGNWYRATIAIRADQERKAIISICQSEEPWEPLGLFQHQILSDEKRVLVFDFHAKLSEVSPNFVVAIGDEKAPVEIGHISVNTISTSEVWIWNIHPECQAQRLMGESPNSIFIDGIVTDGNPWHVQMTGLPRAVHQGEKYRWKCRLIAKGNRKIAFGLRQSVGPYKVVGPWNEMAIGPVEQQVDLEFEIPFEDPTAIPFLLFGESNLGVEIAHLSLEMTQSAPIPLPLDDTSVEPTIEENTHEPIEGSVRELTENGDHQHTEDLDIPSQDGDHELAQDVSETNDQ